jgi:hypothetical protein
VIIEIVRYEKSHNVYIYTLVLVDRASLYAPFSAYFWK